MSEKLVRIGGASAFWGDSAAGPRQLVERAEVDYLVFDYLAEITMSILAGMRARDPKAGYATDFVAIAMRSIVREVAARGIRVISNAGGVNPRACAEALAARRARGRRDPSRRRHRGRRPAEPGGRAAPADRRDDERRTLAGEAHEHERLPRRHPHRPRAQEGAQVVITGRSVDSALALGALMHEFAWRPGGA